MILRGLTRFLKIGDGLLGARPRVKELCEY